MELSQEETLRYSRQLVLPGVGGQGQGRLLSSRVLIIGAGGLGSAVAYYLAAAGVGTLGIIDSDVVDVSNLQRQILHSTKDLGRAKVESAREKLLALNPHCKVIVYQERFSSHNARDIIRDYDLVVDGADNFSTRFTANAVCFKGNKPFIHGGVLSFSGQVLTVVPGKGPCFRCIFKEPPPVSIPTCSQAGVLGAVAGTIGIIQATEALKYILGIGDLLVGRLVTYDALELRFSEVKVDKDPACPVCGENSALS